MPLAMALSLLTLATPVLETRVSLAKTESVSALLRDLSKATGTDLVVSEQRGKEILIVAVDGAPLGEVMKKIAWATYGRWEALRDGFRLVRDSDAEKAAERRYVKWQAEEMTRAIKTFQLRVEKNGLGPWRRWREPGSRLEKADVYDRIIARLLSAVPAEKTVLLDRNDLHTFASHPNAASSPLTNWDQALKSFNAERSPDFPQAVRGFLTCRYLFEVGYASLRLYGPEGQQVGFKEVEFPLYDPQFSETRPLELADRLPPEAPIELSETSKRCIAASGGPSEEGVQRLKQPEIYDPLATLVTDVWRGVARWKEKDLVANVDDAYMDLSWTRGVPNLREAFKVAGGYNAEISGDWLTARPSLPSPPWRHRVNRQALGRLARTQWVGEEAAFQAWSAFAGAQDSTPDSYFTALYLESVDGYPPRDWNSWALARVFGLIPESASQRFKTGNAVALGELPQDLCAALRDFSLMSYSMEGQDYKEEATVRFPDGLPRKGWLSCKASTVDSYAFRIQEANSVVDARMDGASLSSFLKSRLKKEPDFLTRIQVLDSRENIVQYSVAFGPNDIVPLRTFYIGAEGSQKYLPWSQLPEGFRNRMLMTR